MIATLVLSCVLSQQGPTTLVAHDASSAALEAARRLMGRWSSKVAGPPGSVRILSGADTPAADRKAAEDALRVAFAAEGIEVVRVSDERDEAQIVRFAVERSGAEESIVVSAGSPPSLEARVPFVRKPWVKGMPSGPDLLVVASDLHTSEAEARRDADRHVRQALASILRQNAQSDLPGVSKMRRFRERVDREIVRALPAASLPTGTVRDEFVDSRIFSVGPMTRVHLLVDTSGKWFSNARHRVARAASSASHEVVVRGGVIAVGWAILFFFCSVLDRITRGYLTGRLRLIFGGLGVLLLWLLWWA
jgi:hypothetical protein